jgi:hypothetical protein
MTSDRHPARAVRIAALMAACAALASCGGGGSDAGGPAPTPAPGLNDATRTAAAKATAESTTNACASLPSFYWEIGDRAARIASGSVKAPSAPVTYTSSMQLNIASASKWLFGAYVVQKRSGSPTSQDIKHLNFQSGYTNFGQCARTDTVGSCLASGTNGNYTAANDGKFFYNGGHMQKLASLMGLDGLDNASLAFEVQSQIGSDVALSYTEPQLAGGVKTSADEYAKRVNAKLAGKVKVVTYGSSQLGGDKEMVQKLKLGTIDMVVPSTVMSSEVDLFGIFEMPYIVKDRNHMGRIEKEIFWPSIAPEAEKKGLKILAVWENGYRHITNNKRPIKVPADLKS